MEPLHSALRNAIQKSYVRVAVAAKPHSQSRSSSLQRDERILKFSGSTAGEIFARRKVPGA
jgi:hypothetical protein